METLEGNNASDHKGVVVSVITFPRGITILIRERRPERGQYREGEETKEISPMYHWRDWWFSGFPQRTSGRVSDLITHLLEDSLIEELLQLLIAVVDTELLKAVMLKIL